MAINLIPIFIKIKVFNSVLNSVNARKIAEVINDFGERQFGKGNVEYLISVSHKLANLTFEVSRIIKEKNHAEEKV